MKIKIRAAEPGDYEAIRDTMAQPIAYAGTMQLPLPSAEMWKQRLADFPVGQHLLVAEVDGKVVGKLALQGIAKSRRRAHAASVGMAKSRRRADAASVGMAINDAYHGKGVGSALMTAALDLADNWLQFTRIELTVYTDNVAALALYKKFGFEIEGTHKQYAFRHGVNVDAYAMARLKAR